MAQLGAIQPEKAIEFKLKHQGANLDASNTQALQASLESWTRSPVPHSACISMFRMQ